MKSIDYTNMMWGPYVCKMKVDEHIVKRLLDDGEKLKENKRKNNHNRALAGNLENQFKYDKETAEWYWSEMIPYLECYRHGHCEYHNIVYHNVKFQPDSLWVNFMKAGEFNPPHIHTSDLSFVLFLQVPEELEYERRQFEGTASGPGDVVFVHGEYNKPVWSGNTNIHFPKVGDLIIFPALTQHHVHPFHTKGVERVSVSGNLRYIKDKDWPNDYF